MTQPAMRLEIRAPGPWVSANHTNHWSVAAKRKKQWREVGFWYAKKESRHSQKYTDGQTVSIVGTVHRTDNRRADAANMSPTIKSVVDGIVDAGVIPDDSNEFVVSTTERPGEKVSKKDFPHGLLVIELYYHEKQT